MNTSKLGSNLTAWKNHHRFELIDYLLVASFIAITIWELRLTASAFLTLLQTWASSLATWLWSQPWFNSAFV